MAHIKVGLSYGARQRPTDVVDCRLEFKTPDKRAINALCSISGDAKPGSATEPRVLPWRGPFGMNPSDRGGFSKSGREPRRKQRKVRLAEALGGAGNREKMGGSASRIGSHYPPGRIWRAGDGGEQHA